MKRLVTLIMAVGFFTAFSGQSFAETDSSSSSGETKMELKDAKAGKKKEQADDIDQEITNARMRADSGSKSKWSMSVSLGYNGSTVERPLDKDRPSIITAREGNPVVGSASIKGRYRINKNLSTYMGSGFSVTRPFHSRLQETTSTSENLSLSSPYLGVSAYYKLANIQMSSSIDSTIYTSEGALAEGADFSVSLGQTFLWTFMNNKLTVGTAFSMGYYNYQSDQAQLADYNKYRRKYNPEWVDAPLSYLKAQQVDLSGGMYPFAEYSLNETFAFRTVFGYFNISKDRSMPEMTFQRDEAYQSLGVAISPSRNIYIYPNVQFVPKDIKPERTNVAVSATLNVF